MATRLYFNSSASQTPDVSPSFSADWENTTSAVRRIIKTRALCEATAPTSISVSIDADQPTHDRLICQFVSAPLMAQRISGTISFVAKMSENNTGANATLAIIAKIVSQDGSILRGTLYSVFGTDTEFPLSASAATRIVNAQAITALTILTGDRLVIEIGARLTSPTGGIAYSVAGIFGGHLAITGDFALTSGLTTSLNSWIQFSGDLFNNDVKNYQYIKVGNGMGTGERIR